MGRPSIRTPEMIDEICERLSAGEPLAQICRDEHMPQVRTVNEWVADDSDLSARYARAREEGFDAIASKTREIARGKDGSSGDVARDKLIIDTDMRLLRCWDPARYGEKVKVSGAVGVSFITGETPADESI